jgi:hypothetical protein
MSQTVEEVLKEVSQSLQELAQRNWDEWTLPRWKDEGGGLRVVEPARRR